MSDFEAEFSNYFNYFTEVEEQFQRARGTSLFMMSSLDWALVETWKNAGIPLEAVLRGIDAAFEKWRRSRNRMQMVNSVAYCAQAVAEEAKQLSGGAPKKSESAPPFSLDEVRSYLEKNAEDLRKAGLDELAEKLDHLAAGVETHYHDLEALEQTLTAYEDKLVAILAGPSNRGRPHRSPAGTGFATSSLPQQDDCRQLSMLLRSSTWTGTC